jgi:iron complex transport system ATP-binding protein
MRLLRDLAHRDGTSVLVSTHDLDLALRTADQLWLVAGDGRVTCGGPEDLVLAGTVERTFASANVTFDLHTGAFAMRAQPLGTAAVHGDGALGRWTARAVERAGYHVAAHPAEAGLHVHALASDRPMWRLDTPAGRKDLPTLRALVAALRATSAR